MNTKIILAIVAIITGFGLAAQISAFGKFKALTSGDDQAVLAVETAQLVENVEKLEAENVSLQDQKAKLATPTADSTLAINAEIERLKIVVGQTSVEGEGIEIRFEKAIVLSDLIDLVNALRNIGADSIALNDKRVTVGSSFTLEDGKPPLVVKAIGKSQLLKQAVERRGGILDQIGQGSVSEQPNLILPAIKK